MHCRRIVGECSREIGVATKDYLPRIICKDDHVRVISKQMYCKLQENKDGARMRILNPHSFAAKETKKRGEDTEVSRGWDRH